MDELSCPRCKTTKYRNPALKLMVNVCGHALCDNCVELLFVRGSGACPECGVPLRRNNFRLQIFEDSSVEKEVDIRKKILKDFNKKEEDFNTLREYNDYLEMVETIILNLANNTDVEETRLKIEQYKKENQEIIKKNRNRLGRDEEQLEMLLEQEKQLRDYHLQAVQQEEEQAKKNKTRQKEALLDELMFSDLPADHILASHKRDVVEEETVTAAKPVTMFSTGIQMGQRGAFKELSKAVAGEPYVYTIPTQDLCGPVTPSSPSLTQDGYTNHIRTATKLESGGGYTGTFACQRALQDAFCGLYFSSLTLDSVTNKGRQSMEVS